MSSGFVRGSAYCVILHSLIVGQSAHEGVANFTEVRVLGRELVSSSPRTRHQDVFRHLGRVQVRVQVDDK